MLLMIVVDSTFIVDRLGSVCLFRCNWNCLRRTLRRKTKQQVDAGGALGGGREIGDIGDVVGALDNSERHFFLLADCCIGMIELD